MDLPNPNSVSHSLVAFSFSEDASFISNELAVLKAASLPNLLSIDLVDFDDKQVIYWGSDLVSLSTFLQSGITEQQFATVLGGIFCAVADVQQRELRTHALVTDMDRIYVSRPSGLVQFIYVPFSGLGMRFNLLSLIDRVVTGAVFIDSSESHYVEEFVGELAECKEQVFARLVDYCDNKYSGLMVGLSGLSALSQSFMHYNQQMGTQAEPRPYQDRSVVRYDIQSESDGAVVVLAGESAPARKAVLTQLNNGNSATVSQDVFRIGKDPARCDWTVMGNAAVSRLHAEIMIEQGNYYLVDKNSTNRTFVNGELVGAGVPRLLENESIISLGNEEILFRFSGGHE